ncbi:Uncharacterised protein [Vibrio cholerae]|nr:Uncharacterised protein [Vibrio cholerae]
MKGFEHRFQFLLFTLREWLMIVCRYRIFQINHLRLTDRNFLEVTHPAIEISVLLSLPIRQLLRQGVEPQL